MKRNTHLFDLYWEDIIVTYVLPYLTIRECFNFRCVSKTCLQIVNLYFTKMKALKLINQGFSPHTLSVFAINCSKLTVLNLTRCSTVTDADLIPVLRQNVNLVNLNLSWCNNLSAKCLQPVILYCNNLRTLKLARCLWLTTGAMEALALHQSMLEDVDLSHCVTISESCILIFIKKFRLLRTFNLEGCQITDKCLYAMSKNSIVLRMLNLVGCSDITDKGIRALALHCPMLEGLLVRGCTKVTETSLQLMRPRVKMDRRAVDPVPMPIYIQI
ncbi:F-box/LRR-repeat protein 15 [Cydia amplana]|uniref:F-box/LRR-repeat protein 15 n=1 Tax=Cydia amplana TaxID=1869771 RepID=UPI002FE6BFBD